ncbi:DUF1254 domain-containing protein [Chachezhania sediminis]|uniref:DUF1254 domain-containing protein n=1 Tax=Chachezhania sediminis TaxID=2599291 RepID=UPI00131CEAC5|nr:DUF1254 domain-containing protein [Chachezhania sediminis]
MRGVDAFLTGISATSVRAICSGLDSIGIKPNRGVNITEDLIDARSLLLTPNTTTVCGLACLDLSDGPVALEVPSGVLGPVDDADFRWVTYVGLTGPAAGKGGKYLFLPPGHDGKLPTQGCFVQKLRTNTLFYFFRAFVKDCDIAAAVDQMMQGTKLFHHGATNGGCASPEAEFFNASGVRFNTISANDFSFFEQLNQVVQAEPADWVDPDKVGLFVAIGIRKGQPFAPDDRTKAILTDAMAVGNVTARTIPFDPRNPDAYSYPDRKRLTAFRQHGQALAMIGEGARGILPARRRNRLDRLSFATED